ncbi:MAG: hypothetical protein HGA33_00265 [Candidatus Moranbacteria bacterium]|nr:hypothetical protein [Candidatus Moranbacteria bacterium]
MRKSSFLCFAILFTAIGCSNVSDRPRPEQSFQSEATPDTAGRIGPICTFEADERHLGVPIVCRAYQTDTGTTFEVFSPLKSFLSESEAIDIVRAQFHGDGPDFDRAVSCVLEYSKIQEPFSAAQLTCVEAGAPYRNPVVIRITIPDKLSTAVVRR